MTKEEMMAALKQAALKESNALNVKKAEDTLQNIETKEVKDSKAAEGMGADPLPTQKEIEKEVAKDEGPMLPVDKDGVSKDGGDCDKLMSKDGVEAERKKQDAGMKDVINVSNRKVEEASEVNNELLSQLKEAQDREVELKNKMAEMKKLAESALAAQAENLNKEHANYMKAVFESLVKEGDAIEATLSEAVAKNEKMYKTAQKLYENSSKLNKILLEAYKANKAKRTMKRISSPAWRATHSSEE